MNKLEQAKSAIEEVTNQCLEKLEQDPSDIECHSALVSTLEKILCSPTNYSEQEQVDLLNSLKFSILPLNEEGKKHNNVRETHLMIMERLSWLEWKNQYHSVMEFSSLVNILKIVLNRLDREKLINFLPETIKAIVCIWPVLDKLEDKHKNIIVDSLIQFTEIIAELIEVEKKEFKLSSMPEELYNQEYYLTNYLVVTSFEKFIRSTHIPMSPTYYEMYHPKFNVPWKHKQSLDTQAIDIARLDKLIKTSIKAHISIDQLVNYINNFVKSPDSSEKGRKFPIGDFPILPNGVLVYVASIMYYQFMPQDDSSAEKSVIPLSSEYLFRNLTSIASKYLSSDVNELEMADKTLLVLLYLAERNEENTISSDNLESKLSKDGTTIVHLYQAITTFASTSPNEYLRFIAFQLLSRLITLCKDDAKIFLLKELLTSCPFETMKSAAIGIVKDNIAQGLNKAYKRKSADKVIIVDTFLPHILRFESSSVLVNEKEFSEKHGFIMQGLNFYIFLLMRDEKNLQISETNKEYIVPIKEKCDNWINECGKKIQELSKNFQDQTHVDHIPSNLPEERQTMEFDISFEEDSLNNMALTPSQELKLLQYNLFNMQLVRDAIDRVQQVL
ncbi:23139_t:CDS:10, partial [Rhizophagus irregularis]